MSLGFNDISGVLFVKMYIIDLLFIIYNIIEGKSS